MYVSIYDAIKYVCMFFQDFLRLRALTEAKVVGIWGRVVHNTFIALACFNEVGFQLEGGT